MEPQMDEPFIVFIVGFRINNYWKVHKWFPVLLAFKRILKELDNNRDTGCMGYECWGEVTNNCWTMREIRVQSIFLHGLILIPKLVEVVMLVYGTRCISPSQVLLKRYIKTCHHLDWEK